MKCDSDNLTTFSNQYDKAAFMLGNRRVKPFFAILKSKLSRKKIWIYALAVLFKSTFFIFGVSALINLNIQVPEIISYLIIWIILGIAAKLLAKAIYFLFYQF